MDKRTFLKTGALMGIGTAISGPVLAQKTFGLNIPGNPSIADENGEYVLPPLDYAYDALEPYIDKETMVLHHDKHHAGYVNGLNKATVKINEAIENGDFGMIKHWERELAFHGAGHMLHAIFWKNMGPQQGSRSKLLDDYLKKSFGGFDGFSSLFVSATNSVEGSGWGILGYQVGADKLVVLQAEKHQNQSQWLTLPILVCDVWEHSYYLKYQNRRGDYVKAFMNVVNWDDVSERLEKLTGSYQQV
ncbi:MAG: superoxide dismutase [Bacteroidales bacterium]|nr:MAG: superoxide dismutase [Bacteroidales bacterium]